MFGSCFCCRIKLIFLWIPIFKEFSNLQHFWLVNTIKYRHIIIVVTNSAVLTVPNLRQPLRLIVVPQLHLHNVCVCLYQNIISEIKVCLFSVWKLISNLVFYEVHTHHSEHMGGRTKWIDTIAIRVIIKFEFRVQCVCLCAVAAAEND